MHVSGAMHERRVKAAKIDCYLIPRSDLDVCMADDSSKHGIYTERMITAVRLTEHAARANSLLSHLLAQFIRTEAGDAVTMIRSVVISRVAVELTSAALRIRRRSYRGSTRMRVIQMNNQLGPYPQCVNWSSV